MDSVVEDVLPEVVEDGLVFKRSESEVIGG